MQRPKSEPEPFKMHRFKETQSQVRKWIEDEGYLRPQGVSEDESAMQRPATAGGYIRKGEGQRRGPACRDSIFEVRGITQVDQREKTKVKPAVPTRSECRQSTPNRPQRQQDFLTKNALATIRPQSAPQKPSAARAFRC